MFRKTFPVFIVMFCLLLIVAFAQDSFARIRDVPVNVELNTLDNIMVPRLSLDFSTAFYLTCNECACDIDSAPSRNFPCPLGFSFSKTMKFEIVTGTYGLRLNEVYFYTTATTTARNDSDRHDIIGYSSHSLESGVSGRLRVTETHQLKCPIVIA